MLISCGTKDDNTADPIELEAFTEILSTKTCERVFECCPDGVEGFSIERCKMETQLELIEEWNRGIESNMMSYDAALGGQCASEIHTILASLSCDNIYIDSLLMESDTCTQALQGLVVEDRSCEIETDDDYYISDNYCENDLSCVDGICAKLIEAGGSCDIEAYGEGCVEDYYCNNNGNCVSYIAIGESCADEWMGCEFYCENGRCVAEDEICQ